MSREEWASGGQPAANRLVFGLSSRTNRLRHDEYAERRMRQPPSSSKTANSAESNKSSGRKLAANEPRKQHVEVSAPARSDPMRPQSAPAVSDSCQVVPEPKAMAAQVKREEPEPVRKRFNIPPPPMKSLKSPGKSSVVGYAKARIYAAPANAPKGSSLLDSQVVPESIQSGFKPPKQVDVSKARERWEGGEPFARCKSRQRLQAAKDSKWIQLRQASSSSASISLPSTGSLIAMQQLQLQRTAGSAAAPPTSNDAGPLKVLSRGSVLERAQKFEKTDPAGPQATSQPLPADSAEAPEEPEVPSSPLRRRSSAVAAQLLVPRFYHPHGKPNTYELELQKRNIVACFNKLPERSAHLEGPQARRHFQAVAQVCGLSEYWKEPLLVWVRHQMTSSISSPSRRPSVGLQRAASIENSTLEKATRLTQVTCEQFLVCWRKLLSAAYDEPARFVHLLTLGARKYLLADDFVPLLQSLIDDHPGLVFLRGAPDFHMRYIQTVIARIYFNVNRTWTGKLSVAELRASNFLQVLRRLATEEDINRVTEYFSYEHFYVIYCKFWCLDQDHDLLISREDLARHNEAAISPLIIERIFQGVVSKQCQRSGRMSYSDFVWFLMAEEDKRHPRSIEYWFRLMDLDGDGFISMYEMEHFYGEQMRRLEAMSIEPLPFLDSACQILDLVHPSQPHKISLADLKRTQMAPIFFDTFINIEKYLEHESREFVSSRDLIQGGRVVSEWERYASQEYEALVSEESSV